MTAEANQPGIGMGVAMAAEWGVTAVEYAEATQGVTDPASSFAEVLVESGYFTSGGAQHALQELGMAVDVISNYGTPTDRALLAEYMGSLLGAMGFTSPPGKAQE